MVSLSATTLVIGTLAILAVPQVFDMGMTAARTVIAAGLEGAEQIKDGISGQLVALTLAYEKMKSKAKAKAIPVSLRLSSPSQKKAVIGENMLRVAPAAIAFGAETFKPVTFLGALMPGLPIQTPGDFNIWMWANRAWIRSIMVRDYLLIDIGRNITQVSLGWDISPFYAMEVQETAGYFLKIDQPWPPAPVLLPPLNQ